MASPAHENPVNGAVLAQTPLHALHLELGARMQPFAGYAMPLHYSQGILKEHAHVRGHAGLFDVSHMGQLRVAGAAAALEALLPADIAGLGAYRQRYALLTNAGGGVVDDLMITNAGDHFFLVVNAACKERDIAHLRAHFADQCAVDELKHQALLSLQGPAAAKVMARIAPGAARLAFMAAAKINIAGSDCFVTRSGYTGEDGFEISLPGGQAQDLARALLQNAEVAPAGLGARDTLRLEAGYCLYGQDIDGTTTPVEAGLGWTVPQVRRAGGARAGGFPGADKIFDQLTHGTSIRRVGLVPEGRAPVRAGAELFTDSGLRAGRITSGGYGATVGGPIAMGYVAAEYARPGARLRAQVRGNARACTVARLPFVEHHYFRV